MKKTLSLSAAALLLSLSACNTLLPPQGMPSSSGPSKVSSFTQLPKSAYVPGQVVIRTQQVLTQQSVQYFAQTYGLQFVKRSSLGAYLFQHNPQIASPQLAAQVQQDPMVLLAEPNIKFKRQFTVNDPRSRDQKGLGIIGMAKAWDITLGSSNVVVAVVDTGVDLNHPDLQGQLVQGYDALSDGQQPPRDENGHGTHAAGIVAAATDNGIGVAGTAPRAKIMPIRALQGNGDGDGLDVAEGIVWAVDNGASIVNLSLGGYHKFDTVERAIRYALNKNVVVVAAMGNHSEADEIPFDPSRPVYPASQDGVISVGAVDSARQLSYFSNTGAWASVVAPGQAILSTTPTYTAFAGLQLDYDYLDGTSMAAPMVAGVVALMKSRHPQLTPAEVKQRLEGTAIDLGAPGFDPEYGHGMVDAPRAIF